MNHELLCRWLNLPVQPWPPDHYTLLGVPRGEADLQRIERQVHERMARLRSYQLSHPEEATEGMNRVAQAFITLSEAASQPPTPQPPPTPASNGKSRKSSDTPRPRHKDDTAVLDSTRVDWRASPPPVRAAATTAPAKSSPAIPAAPAKSSPAVPVAKPAATAPTEPQDAARLAAELGQHSAEAITGLGTWNKLIGRIDRTRLLLTAWQRLGVLLRKKKLAASAERADFARQLEVIRDMMDVYPAFLGHPGQPGYRVVALARLSMSADMYRAMPASQRDDLLRDWDMGQRILLAHRSFLRREFQAMRRQGQMGLVLRAVRGVFADYALYWAAGAVLLIAAVLIVRFTLF